MANLPVRLLGHVRLVERQAAEKWWAGLSDAARAELALFLDARADSCVFALELDAHGTRHWQALPLSVDSELLADADEADTDWDGAYLEYRLINPETFRVPPYEVRIFYIGGLETTDSVRQPGFSAPEAWMAPNEPVPLIVTTGGGVSYRPNSVAVQDLVEV